LVVLLGRDERSEELEILVWHELSILRRQVRRPQLTPRDRLLLARSAGCCHVAHGMHSS